MEGGQRQEKPVPGSRRSLEMIAIGRLYEFEAREEVADFKSGGFGGVRAVGDVVADAGAEVVPNGAGSSLLGIGGAHRVAPLEDAVFGFENHCNDLARGHEVGQLAKEGALFVDGVKAARFFLGQAHGFDGYDLKTGLVDARENFALQAAGNGVRFDDCEGAFESHGLHSRTGIHRESRPGLEVNGSSKKTLLLYGRGYGGAEVRGSLYGLDAG